MATGLAGEIRILTMKRIGNGRTARLRPAQIIIIPEKEHSTALA